MTLAELARKAAREVWGFVPSREVKPVHFANGFFRALSGHTGSPTRLHASAGGYLSGKTRTTTEMLRQEIEDRFDPALGTPSIEQVKTLRTALDLVLGQDRAVFGSAKNYSFTLTHWQHTSSDASDLRTGRFLAGVLARGAAPEVVAALRHVLDRRDDAIYHLTAPLLTDAQMAPEVAVDGETSDLAERLVQASEPLQAVVTAVGCLSGHAARLEKAAFLHRLVTLGGMGLYVHLVNATAEARTGRRVPMLLCAPQPSAEVREASRATFVRARHRITHAFEEGLGAELDRRGELGLDADALRHQLREWLFAGVTKESDRRRAERAYAHFDQEFAAQQVATDSESTAFVRAAASACFAVIGTATPARAATILAMRTGLVGPFGGPGERYYIARPQLLDALVPALIAPDEDEVPIEEFWRRAWQRFGLLAGVRSQHDAEQLARWGIRQISINRLIENGERLTAELERLGYARTYADTATLVRADV
jgi:hypothetical protein